MNLLKAIKKIKKKAQDKSNENINLTKLWVKQNKKLGEMVGDIGFKNKYTFLKQNYLRDNRFIQDFETDINRGQLHIDQKKVKKRVNRQRKLVKSEEPETVQ